MKKPLRSLVLLAAFVLLVLIAVDERLIIRHYTIETDKVDSPVRLAVVTDYHGCNYGDELFPAIEALYPDAVLLVGDIFDDHMPWEPSEELVRSLASIFPCFYVTGNHEHWTGRVDDICRIMTDAGATVLDATHAELTVNGQHINLCGIPDTFSHESLACAAAGIDRSNYTILLAHRPELIKTYAATEDFDLVISGHAHGGQVRIPFLMNGLFAPNQGFFPKYAGGLYEVDGTTMIVSRGLARESTLLPRVFNRPELVLVTIQ